MVQYNHIRIFPLQTTSNPTGTQQDARCGPLFACPDQRRPPRIKGIRNLNSPTSREIWPFSHRVQSMCQSYPGRQRRQKDNIVYQTGWQTQPTKYQHRTKCKGWTGSPFTWLSRHYTTQMLWTPESTGEQNLHPHNEYFRHVRQWQWYRNKLQCPG